MIKIDLIRKLLSANEAELKDIDTEELRTLLGSFRYFVRMLEREVNRRCADQPFGSIGAVNSNDRKKDLKNKK